jgi:hypothetical protein
MTLALSGVCVGIAATWTLARLLAGALFGVKPHHPVAFVSVPWPSAPWRGWPSGFPRAARAG